MLDWRWFYKMRLRIRTLLRRNQVEQELEEELRYHLEQRIEQEIGKGLAPEEARRAAARAMGGIEQRKEECRDVRRLNVIENVIGDLHYAFRCIGKSPAFSAIAILTLALGISASMGILTIINSALLHQLPFPDTDRLAVLFATNPARGIFHDTTSFPDFIDWKSQSQSFTAIAAWRPDPFNLTGGGVPKPIVGLRTSYELFAVLGVDPALGRGFDKQEQERNAAVAVIGYGLWTSRFAGSRDVLGKSIILDDVRYSVIGVMPQGFQFPSFTDTDVIVPVAEYASRSRGYLRGVARLKPGVGITTARQELDIIAARLEQAYPLTNRGRGVNLVALQEVAVGDVRTPLLVLMGASVFVFLIGCANVGNLVLVRGIARRRELAVRSALGAGAWRLILQLLAESSVLAFIAAALGSAFALWGSKLLAAALSQRYALPPITFDWTLLVLAVLIALVSGVLCGLPPAFIVWKSQLSDSLKEGSRGHAGGRNENRLQSVLVCCETALTIILLVGAGLLLKSFVLLQRTDLGLNPRNVLMADLLLPNRYTPPENRERFLRELLASAGGLPGVQEAAVHTDPPFLGGGARETFHVEGYEDPGPRQGHVMAFDVASGGFFNAMGIPISRGRGFDQRDKPTSPPVVIVNETVARRFWPDGDPIGKRIRLYYDNDPHRWLSIIGVAGDVRYRGRDFEPVPQVFVPYQQNPYRYLPYPQSPNVSLVVRTTVNPASLIKALKARIWAVDKDQAISGIKTMEQALSQSVANRRVYVILLSVFAGIALLMATSGIYGSVSYAVQRRTQEIGIRVAVGATVGRILVMVIRQGLLLTSIGAAIGIAGSLVLTKLISGLLYGITPYDAPTFIAMALLFAAVAFLATYIPARRAASIDPTVAFRCE
jgi:predicted permease